MYLKVITLCITVIALGTAINVYSASAGTPALQTVEQVDLQRYVGKWHEIARLPNRFQKGCTGSSADYSLRDDGEITVINSCRNADDGSVCQARGRAWSVDQVNNACYASLTHS